MPDLSVAVVDAVRSEALDYCFQRDPLAVDEVREGAQLIATRTGVERHDALVVLGSGLRDALDEIGKIEARLPLADLPGVPVPAVEGHGAELLSVRVNVHGGREKHLLVATGRVHLYEGYTPTQVCQLVRVCAMTGITLVSLAGVSELHFSPVGALLTVGAALVWGGYSVLNRVLGHMGYQTVPLTCRIFGYGFLFLLIPTAFEGLPAGITAWGTPVHLANLLFLGLLASATCFVTWNRAVFLLGPVRTSVYIYASPVITIIASALILHETMTPVMWVGTALALGGLMLSEKKTKKS